MGLLLTMLEGGTVGFVSGKSILVTGACGTVGKALIRSLLATDPGITAITGVDVNETDLVFLEHEFISDPRARFLYCDIRDKEGLRHCMDGVDIVFHGAALKHVIVSERTPMQAMQTNVFGVQNVIEMAADRAVGKVIFMSSDKAVNPTSVMGTSKLMAERLMTAANASVGARGPVFASTRFGNVLGSRGSVVPIFHRQIAEGGPVTLTDRQMTRFVMSLDQAISLLITSAELARGGEVFITKMPVARIEDVAASMIEALAPSYGHDPASVAVDLVGSKPGEKLYEELLSEEETRRAVELADYFVVLPAFRGLYSKSDYSYPQTVAAKVSKPYVSRDEPYMSQRDIHDLLKRSALLAPDFRHADPYSTRYWPGDKEERS